MKTEPRVEGAIGVARFAERAYRADLEMGDLFILFAIAGHLSATPQDLLRLELMKRAKLYRRLAYMVEVGCLRIEQIDRDKRRHTYYLTPHGYMTATGLLKLVTEGNEV